MSDLNMLQKTVGCDDGKKLSENAAEILKEYGYQLKEDKNTKEEDMENEGADKKNQPTPEKERNVKKDKLSAIIIVVLSVVFAIITMNGTTSCSQDKQASANNTLADSLVYQKSIFLDKGEVFQGKISPEVNVRFIFSKPCLIKNGTEAKWAPIEWNESADLGEHKLTLGEQYEYEVRATQNNTEVQIFYYSNQRTFNELAGRVLKGLNKQIESSSFLSSVFSFFEIIVIILVGLLVTVLYCIVFYFAYLIIFTDRSFFKK